MNGDRERKVPWTPPPAPVPKQQTPAPRRTTGPVEQDQAPVPAVGPDQAEGMPGVAVLPKLPSLTVDPALGRLSLGISTFDDFDVDAGSLKPAHAAAMADVVDKLGMLLSKFPGGRVTVTGYADLAGGERAELDLGSKRASAVAAALIAAGIPAASIETTSAGAPLTEPATGKPDSAARRVEVRFQGSLVVPGAPGPGPADTPFAVDLTPRPGRVGPPDTPPFLKPPERPGPSTLATPGARGTIADRRPEPGPPKPGKAGDLMKAISKVPMIENWIDRTKEEHLGRLKGLSPGEKVVLTTTVVSMGLLTGAGISTDPGARKAALDLLDGAALSVPGAPWLKLQARTKGGAVGAGLQLDLVKVFPELK